MKSFDSSLPFSCLNYTLAMIINLLIGADVRDTRGQKRRDDSAA